MYTSPASATAQIAVGVVAGEIARVVIKEMGYRETAQNVGSGLVHGGASAATGWAINAAGWDPVTAATVTPATATAGAVAQATFHQWLAMAGVS
jgi:hypothetical protein